jgi:hypothetical protein
MSQLATLGG